MPRFENEDFDPKKRSREDIDRTVPKDEDYYNYSPMDVDLNFNSKKRDDVVVDNQRKSSNYGDYHQADQDNGIALSSRRSMQHWRFVTADSLVRCSQNLHATGTQYTLCQRHLEALTGRLDHNAPPISFWHHWQGGQ